MNANRNDIAAHVEHALANSDAQISDAQIDAIVDAAIEIAPLNSWRFDKASLSHESDLLDASAFWGIVESVLEA